jgi:hypothetical protein
MTDMASNRPPQTTTSELDDVEAALNLANEEADAQELDPNDPALTAALFGAQPRGSNPIRELDGKLQTSRDVMEYVAPEQDDDQEQEGDDEGDPSEDNDPADYVDDDNDPEQQGDDDQQGDDELPDDPDIPEAEMIAALDRAKDSFDDEKFFAALGLQYAQVRYAMRIARSIVGFDPDYLRNERAAKRPHVDIEAALHKARVVTNTLNDWLIAANRQIEKVETWDEFLARHQKGKPRPKPGQLSPEPKQRSAPTPAAVAAPPASRASQVTLQAPPNKPFKEMTTEEKRAFLVAKQKTNVATIKHARKGSARGTRTKAKFGKGAARGPAVRKEAVKPSLIAEARRIITESSSRPRGLNKQRIARFCASVRNNCNDEIKGHCNDLERSPTPRNAANLAKLWLDSLKDEE